jgi:hypothetical protein
MNAKKINWFGIVGGSLVLVVLVVSIFYPWWQLVVGKNVAEAFLVVNASPINTNIVVLGSPFTIPLIWAANLAVILTFLCGGIIMLVYSVIPMKSYSKDLLGFAYKKPLYAVIGMVVVLLILIIALQSFTGVSVPIMGTSTVSLPSSFIPGVGLSASAQMTTAFLWPFWLAIVATGLCVAARIYHRKLSAPKLVSPGTATTEPSTGQTLPPPPPPAPI